MTPYVAFFGVLAGVVVLSVLGVPALVSVLVGMAVVTGVMVYDVFIRS